VNTARSDIAGPAAWYGRDLRESDEWIHRFTPDELHEIRRAIRGVRERGIDLIDLAKEDFALPELGPTLSRIQHEVVHGRGFVLLRGLPVDRYTMEEIGIAYLGIGLHFGWPVSQNAEGHLLGHVRDIGRDPTNPEHRIYTTSARHLYHTDSSDIVGLLCLQPAMRGGLSSVVSSVTVYKEMLARRPDLVAVLERPFHVDRKGEVPDGKGPHYRMGVFHHYEGHLTTIYARDFIESAQRFDDVPRLKAEQIEALDLLDALASHEDLRLDMTLESGDIQFLHNHQTLHARTAYEDYPEPERKRHLLRLWLAPPNGWALPPVFEERYGNIEVGTVRGGIRVPGTVLCAPLTAEK